jgi:Na+/H+-dicarboxylate symporter
MCKTAVANVTTVIAGTAAVRAHLQQLIATSQIAFHVTSTIAVTMTAVIAAALPPTAWARRLSIATSQISPIPLQFSSILYPIP